MSDKEDEALNQDLDNLDSTSDLGDQKEWDKELEDDLIDSDDVIEFEQDEVDPDESDDESAPKKDKGKKTILPLVFAGVLVTSVAGFLVVQNTNILGSNPKVASIKNQKPANQLPINTLAVKEKPAIQEANPVVLQEQSIELSNSGNQVAALMEMPLDLNTNDMVQTIDFGVPEDTAQQAGELELTLGNQEHTVVQEPIVDIVEEVFNKPAQIAEQPRQEIEPAHKEIYTEVQSSVSTGLNEQEMQSLISQAVTSSNSDKDSSVLSLLQQMSSRLDELNGEITSLKSTPTPDVVVNTEFVEKVDVRLSDSEKTHLTSGRDRLKGFHVVNTSEDGTMSIVEIVKEPRNRISVFFKGEKIILKKKGVFTIKGIYDSGYLVLVNDKWYIDETLEQVKKPKKSVEVLKVKPKPKAAVKPVINSYKPKAVIVSAASKPDIIYQVAEGWLLNGIYNEQFLIQTPSGEWKTSKIGDKLEGLGLINGLDKERNLIVGQYLIKLSEN